MVKAHRVAAFYVAACPRCAGLQVMQDLGATKAATCRKCGKRTPGTTWTAADPFVTAQQARDALIAAQDPISPQPLTLGPVAAAERRATRNERLLSLLGDLRKPSYTWAQLEHEFQAAGLASALPGLTNSGHIYQPMPGVDTWRISRGAALQFTE